MPTAPRWSVVVPVKRPEVAKTRLADLAGARRPELARAFAADTVAAALACPDVADVVVVTDDTQTAAEASAAGALVVSDEPAAGLNAALRHGADVVRRRHPDRYIAALSADLPALRPDELATTLQAATVYPVSFVGDVAGTGTTLYAVTLASGFEPRFGGRSRAAHRAAGAVELTVPDTASVHRDVDTAVDLWDAVRLGIGPRTAAVVALI